MSADKTYSHKLILFVFLAVICLFTAINAYEFVANKEAEGHILGLNKLSTVEDYGVTAWGGIQKLMGKKLAFGTTTYEDVTLLNNGYATMADQDSNYQPAVEGVTGAKQLADSIGADFLYVAVPPKQRGPEDLPDGVVDYAVDKYYGITSEIKSQGISLIPMRDVLENSGQDWFSYFYLSDHHWRNNGAFICYQQICDYMNGQGMPINQEAYNPDSYEIKQYQDVFLGTHGRMAGPMYTGLDGYELYLPKFETSFTLDVPSQGIHKEGNFEEAFVNYENVDHYSYDYYAYYTYLKEDYDLFEIVNNHNPEGAHVLIVRDSSAVPVSVFLANQCSELDIVDLRYTTDRDVRQYITDKSPDLIIYLFGSGYLGNSQAVIIP